MSYQAEQSIKERYSLNRIQRQGGTKSSVKAARDPPEIYVITRQPRLGGVRELQAAAAATAGTRTGHVAQTKEYSLGPALLCFGFGNMAWVLRTQSVINDKHSREIFDADWGAEIRLA